MARYFNKTSTPLSFSFGEGHSMVIPPLQWITVAKEHEGSASLIALCAKRHVVRVEEPQQGLPAPKPKALTEPAGAPGKSTVAEVVSQPTLLTEVPAQPSGSPMEEGDRGGARRKGGRS